MIIMRIRPLLITILTASAVFISACGGTPSSNGNTNAPANKANAVDATTNNENPVATTKKAEVATANNAPTIAPVVHAFYDALRKKDDAALTAVLSAEFIKSIRADMKAEKKTGMAAYLAETETIPDKPIEVRNEKIVGDKAVAEIKGGAYLNWTAFAFIKEGGAWKFTGGSPEIDNVKQK